MTISINSHALHSALDAVRHFTARDPVRAEAGLDKLALHVEQGRITLVATDGVSMAVARLAVEHSAGAGHQFLLPRDTVAHTLAVLKTSKKEASQATATLAVDHSIGLTITRGASVAVLPHLPWVFPQWEKVYAPAAARKARKDEVFVSGELLEKAGRAWKAWHRHKEMTPGLRVRFTGPGNPILLEAIYDYLPGGEDSTLSILLMPMRE